MPATAAIEGEILGTGPSAPGVFKSALFDYQLAKFLGLVSYSGAETGECFTTAHRIKDEDFESWTIEWLNLAQRIEIIANKSLIAGHRVSAREAFLRAASYYQAAFYFLFDKDPRKREYHAKHIAAFASAGRLFDPPFEAVQIPYEGKSLPGWYLRPSLSDTPCPTVIIQMGADGTAVQTYFSGGGAAAIRRGYNVLLFEGPGQTSAFYQDSSLIYRYDWEVPIGAAVDYLHTKPEVDKHKTALIAYSLGGYFGPRAVAFEKRISALVVSSLVPDGYDMLMNGYGIEPLLHRDPSKSLTLSHQQRYGIEEHMPKHGFNHGLDDIQAWADSMKSWKLWDLADRIDIPLLNLTGTSEGEAQIQVGREFFAKLPNKRNKFIVTTAEDGAEMHCQKGNSSLLHQIEFDWLDEIFEFNA